MNLKKELLNLKKARKKLTNEQYVKYVKDFKEADKCNKESFEKHLMIRKILPIFKKTPKKIIQLIKNEYAENPASAGNFAQDVLSFTQLTNNLYLANCSKEDYEKINPLREITCKTHFPNSNICIGWQVDLFQEEMLYEFKLTTEKNFEKTLQKQLLQLCLYDFLFRKEYAHKYPLIVKSELKKIIEVYLMDKDEIRQYTFYKTNTELLTKVLSLIGFNEQDLNEIDEIYTDLMPVMEEAIQEGTNLELDRKIEGAIN